MKIIENTTEFNIESKTAVAIGKFDGVHLGHRELLRHITDKKAAGLSAAVFTFDPPASAFFGGACVKELMTKEEKRDIFNDLGVDILLEFPLNEATARIEASYFIKEILVKGLNMKYIACGEDVSFGYKGQGNKELLLSLADELGYETVIVPKLKYEGQDISSTRIRRLIKSGDIKTAKLLLGQERQEADV